jgi:dihydrolipoamide dehydrogenase
MYDVIVIGAGPAGYEAAALLGEAGKEVCLVEKNEKLIGGTCLTEGCIPAKNFLESASYVAKQKYFETCGVNMQLNSFDIEGLKTRTNSLIEDLQGGIGAKLKKAKVTVKYANATFINDTTIKLEAEESQEISAKHIIIASGSIHREHPLLKVDGDRIISSREMFQLTSIPKSVLVVGGGAIGCEFATFLNSFGCNVDIAEFTSQLVPNEDEDIAKALKRELEKKGIEVSVKANVTGYSITDNAFEVTVDLGKKTKIKTYEKVLVSIGRIPNTSELGLENTSVKTNKGFIEVNDNLQANSNIYAIGDVIHSPALAHMAYYEAKRVVQHLLQIDTFEKETIIPWVTFSAPQVASIGQNEKFLKENSIPYKTKKLFFKSNGKAKIKGDDSGFVKVVYNEETNKILGASIIGNDATELIHQFLIAINANLAIKDIEKMIFAHPTLSESTLDLLH